MSILSELHDDICTLVDYKKKLNDFYRDKFGGMDITDIMEAEIASAEGMSVTIGEPEPRINCSHHKGNTKIHG